MHNSSTPLYNALYMRHIAKCMAGLASVPLIVALTFAVLFFHAQSTQAAAPWKNTAELVDKLVQGGREEVARRPIYQSAYYRGGYPPEKEGVCTDLIWRAFKVAGYDLKTLIDADIRSNPSLYPRVGKKPDPSIDFRRVPNQTVYFKRHAKSLSTKITPGNMIVMNDWKKGDIVVFRGPDHIAILSDKRNSDGIPYLIHNQGPWATEGDDFMYWYGCGIVAHFRLP